MKNFFENNLYFKEKFKDTFKEHKYKKNDVIGYQIDKEVTNTLFIVTKGLVLVETKFGESEMSFYSFIGKNHIFGWINLNVKHAAVAQEETTLIEIDRDVFFNHLYISPDLYHKFLSNIIQDFFLLAESYQYVNKSPVSKLLNSLLNISNKMGLKPDKNGCIEFPRYINPTFIGKYARSSEPNISKAGAFLEKQKIIERNPYRILNQEKARKLLYEEYS